MRMKFLVRSVFFFFLFWIFRVSMELLVAFFFYEHEESNGAVNYKGHLCRICVNNINYSWWFSAQMKQ